MVDTKDLKSFGQKMPVRVQVPLRVRIIFSSFSEYNVFLLLRIGCGLRLAPNFLYKKMIEKIKTTKEKKYKYIGTMIKNTNTWR